MKAASIGSLALLLSLTAQAADPKGVIAVLPFDFREAKLDQGAQTALMESIRTDAADAFSPAGYTVLTGENTLAILQDNGVDAAKACDTSCSLDTARELKAKLFLSATVATTDGTHLAFVRLFESAHGTVLSSAQLEGKNVLELRASFRKQAQAFFQKALQKLGAAPAPTPAPVVSAVAPTPKAVEPPAEWISDWITRYPDGWTSFQKWASRHPEAATQFTQWESHEGTGFRQVADWALAHPAGTPVMFAHDHPKWPQIDATMRVHALGCGFLFEWIRKHSKAALNAAEHPHAFQALNDRSQR